MTTLSDGVFAIVMTLLVLELKPDQANPLGLFADLRATLPKLEAWLISFLTVGVIWALHHNVLATVQRVDNVFNWLNLFLLMSVSLIPWTTDLMGTYSDPWAVVLFSGNLGVCGLLLTVAWVYASGQGELIDENIGRMRRQYITLRLVRMPLLAVLSIGLAFLSRSLGLWAWALFLPLGLVLRLPQQQDTGTAQD